MILRLALAAALLALAPVPAEAQSAGGPPVTVVVRPSDRPGDIDQIIRSLRAQGRDVVLRIDEPDAAAPGAAAGAPAPPSAGAAPAPHGTPLWTPFLVGTARGSRAFPPVPRLAAAAGRAWRGSRNPALPLLLVLGLAALAAAAVHAGARHLARRRLARPAGDFAERLSWAALRGGIDGAALLAFAVAGHVALSRLLPQPDFVRATGQALLDAVTLLGLALAGARFLLAPDRPARRLLPIARPSWHRRMLVASAAATALAVQGVSLLEPLGEPAGVTGWFLLASTLVAGLDDRLVLGRAARHRGARGGLGRRRLAAAPRRGGRTALALHRGRGPDLDHRPHRRGAPRRRALGRGRGSHADRDRGAPDPRRRRRRPRGDARRPRPRPRRRAAAAWRSSRSCASWRRAGCGSRGSRP